MRCTTPLEPTLGYKRRRHGRIDHLNVDLGCVSRQDRRCDGRDEWQALVLVGAKDGDEGFLGYIDPTELLHFRLALLLFIEELVLTRNVAAIKFRGHILTVRLDRRSRNDCAANGALDRDLELVAWNRFGKLFTVVNSAKNPTMR